MATNTQITTARIVYWLFFIAVHLYVCYFLFTTQRALAGSIWLIVGLVLIYVFYYVYFPPGLGTHWPPYVTYCPDYLTKLSPTACVDFVGLNSPKLAKADPANPPVETDSKYVFNPSGTHSEKVARALQYGLTWDGLT